MLTHGEAKVLITDPSSPRSSKPLWSRSTGRSPLVIDSMDPDYTEGEQLGEKDYEAFPQ